MKKRIQLAAIFGIAACISVYVAGSVLAQETQSQAKKLIREAIPLLRGGETTKAIQIVKSAIAADANSEDAWLWSVVLSTKLPGQQPTLQLQFWDDMARTYPSNTYPRVFKAVTLSNYEQFSQVDTEFQKAVNIAPRNPLVYAYMLQVHLEMGQYDKARSDFKNYKELGGHKMANEFAPAYDLLLQALDRQFRGVNLPPPDWKMPKNYLPDLTMSRIAGPWLEQLCNANVKDPKFILGGKIGKGFDGENKRYKFVGLEDSPFEYAPGFYIWGGTVIVVPEYGALVVNGTKLKHVEVVNGARRTHLGVVKDWRFTFDERTQPK